MTEKTAAVVIGAGVVGLACARALALRGIETIILEANDAIGLESSSRNSEVIHAGLYYPAGSLKARLRLERSVLRASLPQPRLGFAPCSSLKAVLPLRLKLSWGFGAARTCRSGSSSGSPTSLIC